jgi:spore coat polysaccharide biosynthesis predicted glycosyltransferase SpsG
MREVDLAVCGGGVTLYECLAAGAPVVGACLAENQRHNLETLHRAGAIVHAVGALETALSAVARDAGQRAAMRAMGRRIVDGRGAERVAAELERALAARLQRRR